LQKVNGYGKREVANTTVVTKLDKLERQIERKGQKLHEARSELADLDAEIKEVKKSRRREERYATKRKERVDEGLEQGSTRTVKFKQAVQELRDSTKALEDTEDRINQLQAKRRKAKQQKSKAERQIEK
jgi:chromosome segregation ATPase